MTMLLDAAGRRRSPVTMPGYGGGRPPTTDLGHSIGAGRDPLAARPGARRYLLVDASRRAR
jgi:hypothetical protein